VIFRLTRHSVTFSPEITTLCSLTQADCMLCRVLPARAMPLRMASSKLSWELAEISVTLATDMVSSKQSKCLSSVGAADAIAASATRRACFLSFEDTQDHVVDDDCAVPALEERGWAVTTLPWRQRDRNWSDFDAVVVRSTWDYWDDVTGFLVTLEAIDGATTLANPLGLMRWNLSKTYLRDLEAAGIAIVPTHWHDILDRSALVRGEDAFGADLVVKPQVGGNGEGVLRLAGPDSPAASAALERFRHTPCMVQPFRPQVVRGGETSLFYFHGRFSHAVNKRPAAGEFRSQEERGAHIASITPDRDAVRAGDCVLGALDEVPLYARVDLLSHPERGWELVELELIEPSLYFRTDPEAAPAFARAFDRWLSERAVR